MSRQQIALLWSARCTCFRSYKHLAALRPHYFNLTIHYYSTTEAFEVFVVWWDLSTSCLASIG
jgi:hypothetical protein